MGLQRTIEFPTSAPSWSDLRARLLQVGFTPQMRLIDNLPAFPDEEPEETWQDLRFTLGHGMLTLRRSGKALTVLVWGNADSATQQEQELVAKLCLEMATEKEKNG